MKKAVILIITLSAILLLALCPAAEGKANLMSPALNYLAAQSDMAMSGMAGNPVTFTKDDFLRSVNLSDFTYITVTAVPDEKDGRLSIGSTAVSAGQRVSVSNIPQMSFTGADASAGGSFLFSVDGGAYSYTCNVSFLSEMNYAPTLNGTPDLELAVSTHSGLSATGTLYASDPENDRLTYRIVGFPEHGSVVLTDCHAGVYEYVPTDGFTGKDTFVYAVYDSYGNWSPSASITVNVTIPKVSIAYADLADDATYNAALTMTEEGVMSGYSVGGTNYFQPNRTITRAEFVVTMMHAVGITNLPDTDKTVFADDAEIDPSMKSYISAAHSLGYVTGSISNGRTYFKPNEEITRAEAAVMIGRVTGLTGGTVAVFADSGNIPAWAQDSVYCLYRKGILTAVDGKISPTVSLTRGDAAIILERLIRYMDGV